MNATTRVFHISDEPGISMFEPRPSPHRSADVSGSMVWAIDEDHIQNYLLPRDCPRVTFFACNDSSVQDIATFLGPSGARHVIAVEACWLPRIQAQSLVRYEFDRDPFEQQDGTAGYWICREPVAPVAEVKIHDVLAELLEHDIELRIMRSLWKLREAVINSSLEFSIIRMKNASIPPEGVGSYHPLP